LSILRFNPDQGPDASTREGEAVSSVPETFESFVDRYYQAAYRFALSLTGNPSDAGDITQQAFYLAHSRAHQLRDSAKRKQWLFTILHREFLRTRRREAAHPQVNLELSESSLPPIQVDHATGLDGKALLVALQGLEPAFRSPLVLFYLEQLSYKEIAATLEVPIGTVMSRLARGKQMLRQRLDPDLARDGRKEEETRG
jgi:RNA polymerase sigma-70 factor (ECF subfamily)